MGQKISPHLFRAHRRLSNTNPKGIEPSEMQKSVWFASGKNYSTLLFQDHEIREYLTKELLSAGIVDIIIRRNVRKLEITLYVTRPGVVIGKGGASINKLRTDLVTKFNLAQDFKLNIEEFRDPFRSANVIANDISEALKRNIPYRRLIKTTLEKMRYSGIKGAKIQVKGRLNGAEIARKEEVGFGSIPRHTIDSMIDIANVPSKTAAGIIGVRVLINHGDKFTNYTY
jgi:small subunit ribosomal protein S3